MEERQMMRRVRKGAAAFLLAGIMVLVTAAGVYAATEPIKSVSIRVSAKLEAGSSLPEIEIGSGSPDDGGVRVSGDNSRYSVSAAEWLDKGKKELKAADEPQMKVTLEPVDVGDYYFLASYRSSNVKVSGGKFVSARRDGDRLVVTLRLNGVKGEYDPPLDAFWNENNLGEARWEKPANTSGYYEVQLFRNNKSIYRVPKTTAVKYNFYPYMTEKGDYIFKVRTVPETELQVKYGKKAVGLNRENWRSQTGTYPMEKDSKKRQHGGTGIDRSRGMGKRGWRLALPVSGWQLMPRTVGIYRRPVVLFQCGRPDADRLAESGRPVLLSSSKRPDGGWMGQDRRRVVLFPSGGGGGKSRRNHGFGRI